MTARTIATSVGSDAGRWLNGRFDVNGGPSGPLELSVFLDSFLPSLMPRTSVHQGLAAGLNVSTARGAASLVGGVGGVVSTSAGLWPALGVRATEAAIGQALSMIPESEEEPTPQLPARRFGGGIPLKSPEPCTAGPRWFAAS